MKEKEIDIVNFENCGKSVVTKPLEDIRIGVKNLVSDVHDAINYINYVDGIYSISEKEFREEEVGKKARNIQILYEKGFLVPKTYVIPHVFCTTQNIKYNLDKIDFHGPWIVRSSSLEEDNTAQSNAGIFKSIVVHKGKENLHTAIIEVINHALSINATPSVVIQEYIEGSHYGVGFSKFLINNNSYLPVVEFSFKAEAVTGGVDKVQRYYFLGADEEIELKPPLNFLAELRGTLNELELIFNGPQDIEFVVKDGMLYLLQSRECVNTLNGSDWWNWTKRNNTPIFPCLFRTQINSEYQKKFNSYNQYILVRDGGTTHMMYNKNDIMRFQEEWIKRLLEGRENFANNEIEFENRLNNLISFSEMLKRKTNFDSEDDIISKIEEYRKLYACCVNISNEAFLGGFVLERYLRTWLDVYLSNIDTDLTTAQVFNILTNSTNILSGSGKLKKDIIDFSKELKEDLYVSISNNDYEEFNYKITIYPELKEKWIKIYEDFKWLGFNWIGPGLTYETMFDILRGIINNGEIKQSNNDKEKLYEIIGLEKKDQYLFDLLAHFVYLKDWRNGMYSRAAFNFYHWLEDVSKKKGFNIADLYDMSLGEVKEFIRKGVKPKRNENDLVLRSNEGGKEVVLTNKQAEEYLNERNIVISPDYDKNINLLEGEAVSEGRIKGKVRIFSSEDNYCYGKDDIVIATSVHPTETGMIANVGGIIVEEGGITSHISILAREAGIPCIINVENACRILKNNESITLDANNGYIIRNDNKQ